MNSAEGTVTGFGPIDGGRLALGKNGRLHVAWMRISPTAFFYTRANEDGQGFEEQFAVASGPPTGRACARADLGPLRRGEAPSKH